MEQVIVFLPLVAAAVAGLGRRQLGARAAEVITTAAICAAALLAIATFNTYALESNTRIIPLLTWIKSGNLNLSWALNFDALTAVMVLVVTSVSAMVHIYSIGYMHEDPSRAKFMAYLSLFTFAMLMLVTADNFVQMFFGWEGVGLASYLLIGFWNDRQSANAAAIKAFVVNRVGDFGFVLGIFTVFVLFGTLNFTEIFALAAQLGQNARVFTLFGHNFDGLTLCCLLLFVGAMGKSAQLGLHTWLPDAMEGPTPVSALIHAATMVTAGVFMLVRISPLLELAPVAAGVITVFGALTCFVGAAIAFSQFDIKKVIAYSTMSQLGYMVFAAGSATYGAAIFHLFTHAFFKALLFLGAGAVIHAMHHEQDMRHYGGLRRQLPVTYILMWIGSLALAGFPFLAGYYSKDTILEAAWAADTAASHFAFWIGLLVACMTAMYSSKVMYLTFHGRPRYDVEHAHIHEAPPTMLIPLCVLAIGALLAGFAAHHIFVGEHADAFWGAAGIPAQPVLHAAHHVPGWVKLAPLVATFLGLFLGWLFYLAKPALPAQFARNFNWLYELSANKFYFDRVYDKVFGAGAPLAGLAFWQYGDRGTIDRFGPDGISYISDKVGKRFSLWQTGFLYHYAFVMLIALTLLVGWFLWHSMAV